MSLLPLANPNSSASPMITVVIPTRNRAFMVRSLLISLANQTLNHDFFEVIVVDNGSTDNTASMLDSLRPLYVNTKILREPLPGLHHGRHRGLAESVGTVIVYADDDIEPLPTWLESIRDVFLDESIALMGGNNLPLFMGMPPDWLYQLWNANSVQHVKSVTMLSIQENPPGTYDFNPFMVWGCNFAIRKDVLIAAGGFHPDGMPQDLIRFRGDGETHVSKYVADNNLKCIFDSRASVYHKVTPERMTLNYFRKRGFNQGVSDSYTHLRNPPEAHLNRPPSSHQKLLPILKTKLRTAKSKALGWASQAPPAFNPAQVAFQEGYKQGFSYHQNVYASDPEVRAWVHKETYF